jgi:hypothetical protein
MNRSKQEASNRKERTSIQKDVTVLREPWSQGVSKWISIIIRIVGGGAQLDPLGTAAYCTCPRWLWWWRIWWNEDWQGNPKYSEKTGPSATLSTTNPTWPDPGSNPGRRGGKPATYRLSYGAALTFTLTRSIKKISAAIQRIVMAPYVLIMLWCTWNMDWILLVLCITYMPQMSKKTRGKNKRYSYIGLFRFGTTYQWTCNTTYVKM